MNIGKTNCRWIKSYFSDTSNNSLALMVFVFVSGSFVGSELQSTVSPFHRFYFTISVARTPETTYLRNNEPQKSPS